MKADGSPCATELTPFTDWKIAKRGIVLLTRAQLITAMEARVTSEYEFAAIISTEAGEKHLGGSAELHRIWNVHRIILAGTSKETPMAKNQMISCWLVNLGNHSFTPTKVAVEAPSAELTEVSLRFHIVHTEPAYFSLLTDSPVKYANLAMKELWPPNVREGAENISIAFRKKAKLGGQNCLVGERDS